MFHVETKGYNDLEHRSYPDIILTEYATFDGDERWPDVVRAFARFVGHVYGYDVEAKFNEQFNDPLATYIKENLTDQ
jgi:hypothetical protein